MAFCCLKLKKSPKKAFSIEFHFKHEFYEIRFSQIRYFVIFDNIPKNDNILAKVILRIIAELGFL